MRVFYFTALALLFMAGLQLLNAGPITLGANIISNGDAESGLGSTTGAVVSVPDWITNKGSFTAVTYGAASGFPTSTDPGPATRGSNFFAGGPDAQLSIATQLVNVSSLASVIDAGLGTYVLSGYFGGFSSQRDNAVLYATFFNSADANVGSASIGNVSNTDRGNVTGLLAPLQVTGAIPVDTKTILFQLNFFREDGSYNDGYADNLSLIINGVVKPPPPSVDEPIPSDDDGDPGVPSPVPEPGTMGLMGLGGVALAWYKRFRFTSPGR